MLLCSAALIGTIATLTMVLSRATGKRPSAATSAMA